MPAFAFDTLKATRTLTAAGMAEPVAEAVVETMNDAVTEGVATKADIAKLEAGLAKLEADVAKLESENAKQESRLTARIETEVGALKSRLDAHQWVLGFNSAMLFLIAARLFGAF